jgi:hypothetical protein
MESYIVEPRFQCLFTDDEYAEAWARLRHAGYDIDSRQRDAPSGPPCPRHEPVQ